MNKLSIIITLCCLVAKTASAQLVTQSPEPINRLAVPFLLLPTDVALSGMGNSGTALFSSTSNAESNPAKANFIEEKFGVNLTYTPWLKKLVNDRKLMYIGGFYKISEKTTITTSLNYLSYGQIDLVDVDQVSFGAVQPNEYVWDIGLSKSFSTNFALGLKFKIIHSNLFSGAGAAISQQPGTGYCIDLSAYHIFPLRSLTGEPTLAVSVIFENIGPKISYFNEPNQKSYLPSNLKVGTALKTTITGDNEIGLALDFSKLLVPYQQLSYDASVMESIVSSFGSGFDGIGVSLGAEYSIKKTVSFRAGYNFQGDERLPGSFFSAGLGIKKKNVAFNLAYLSGNPQRTFLSNTLRFSLGYSL